MQELNKSIGDDILKNWKKKAGWGMYIASICIILWLAATVHSPNVCFDSENVTALNTKWTAVSKGKSKSIQLPANIEADAGEKVRFTTELKQQDVYVNTIMVKALHNYMRIYLDDTLLDEFGYDNTTPFGNAPYAGYMIVRLPENWQGKTLTIEQTGYYDNYSGVLGTVYAGTKNALVYHIFKQCAPGLLINFSIIALSFFLIIISFFYPWPGIIMQLRATSIFSIITGTWLILESGGYQLFLERAPLVSNSIFILFSLIPVAAIRFIQTYKTFKDSRFMNVLYLLSILNFIAVHILQFFRAADYIETIWGSHLIIILIFAEILREFILTRIHRKKLQDVQLYAACIVFAVFGCVDIVKFYIGSPLLSAASFSQAGMALFLLVLMFSAVGSIVADRENSMKKDVMQQLAFTDLLTTLPNRNAFEEKMDSYRNKENPQHPLIILADLNCLKKINDTLGHKKGDEAIVCTGHVLRDLFPESAHVYRIGGDEFCIISDFMDVVQAEACIINCQKRLQEMSAIHHMKISASFGMCRESGEGVENALITADKNMYKNKLLDKRNNLSN